MSRVWPLEPLYRSVCRSLHRSPAWIGPHFPVAAGGPGPTGTGLPLNRAGQPSMGGSHD
jgi:hypothetical protein